MTPAEHVVQDYATISLSVKAHPVSFIREKLRLLHIVAANELKTLQEGMIVKVAGLVLVRQRPGTAKGVCFITLEDETGLVNLVIFQKLFDEYRKPILQSSLLMAEGRLQIEGDVIHVIVERCYDLSKLLRELTPSRNEVPSVATFAPPEGRLMPAGQDNRTQAREHTQKVFPEARNFK